MTVAVTVVVVVTVVVTVVVSGWCLGGVWVVPPMVIYSTIW